MFALKHKAHRSGEWSSTYTPGRLQQSSVGGQVRGVACTHQVGYNSQAWVSIPSASQGHVRTNHTVKVFLFRFLREGEREKERERED